MHPSNVSTWACRPDNQMSCEPLAPSSSTGKFVSQGSGLSDVNLLGSCTTHTSWWVIYEMSRLVKLRWWQIPRTNLCLLVADLHQGQRLGNFDSQIRFALSFKVCTASRLVVTILNLTWLIRGIGLWYLDMATWVSVCFVTLPRFWTARTDVLYHDRDSKVFKNSLSSKTTSLEANENGLEELAGIVLQQAFDVQCVLGTSTICKTKSWLRENHHGSYSPANEDYCGSMFLSAAFPSVSGLCEWRSRKTRRDEGLPADCISTLTWWFSISKVVNHEEPLSSRLSKSRLLKPNHFFFAWCLRSKFVQNTPEVGWIWLFLAGSTSRLLHGPTGNLDA